MRWGLLGYGRIARKFEESIRASHAGTIVAVASRSQYSNIPSAYCAYQDYAALLKDDTVQIVYVCTTHNTHKDLTIQALEAGKHVLCEKPMSTSPADVKSMTECARINNRFLMEALWSRYLPGYQKALAMIHQGAIGDIQLIQANFGFRMNPNEPKERLVNPHLAGGAVWDVGIYPISLAMDICRGLPTDIQALARKNPAGVEESAVINLAFENNTIASLTCSFEIATDNRAFIYGSHGRIVMDDFWMCERVSVTTPSGNAEYHLPMTSTGYYHEILACQELIERQLLQSDLISWQDSWEINYVMDRILRSLRSNPE